MKIDTELAELQAENEQLKQQNQWLLEQLTCPKAAVGVSSEKNQLDNGEQLGLFNEAELWVDESQPKQIKAYTRRTACKVGMGNLPKDLPVEVIEHDLPAEQKTAPTAAKACM
jgi:hypothetical protein